MATKKGLNGQQTVQPGNYRKGPWDGVSEQALDTEASHSIADSNLGLFGETDEQMDRNQQVGYVYVRWAKINTTEPLIKKALQNAEVAFGQAERWEALNEENVADGHGAVKRARISNHGVIGIAEDNRRAAAQAQRSQKVRVL